MESMLSTGLEFAAGTTDTCKKYVLGAFSPREILDAYRAERARSKTGDLVLVSTKGELSVGTRAEYAKHLRGVLGARASEFGVVSKSAHSVAQLPFESEAMWLVIVLPGQDMPSMCVIFAVPYETAAASN